MGEFSVFLKSSKEFGSAAVALNCSQKTAAKHEGTIETRSLNWLLCQTFSYFLWLQRHAQRFHAHAAVKHSAYCTYSMTNYRILFKHCK